jgi:hypothetical protein
MAKENKMKATKKPVTIECFKYDGDLMNSDGKYYVPDWAQKAYEDGTISSRTKAKCTSRLLKANTTPASAITSFKE